MSFYIKPPRTLPYDEAMRLATEVTRYLCMHPEVQSVILCGSLARAVQGGSAPKQFFGDIDLVIVSNTAWEHFRTQMSAEVSEHGLITKAMRFKWAHEALKRGVGPCRPSPLDPYQLGYRTDFWANRLDVDGGLSPSPLLDVYILPSGWNDTKKDVVIGALGSKYSFHSGFFNTSIHETWDPALLLGAIAAEGIPFDRETECFMNVP